jgi:hypothetical protein
LGVGGWNEADDELEHVRVGDRNSKPSADRLLAPADFWTVLVENKSYQATDAPWFKIAKSGDTGELWLEGDEIFVFLDNLKSTARSICVHFVEDDVSAIVPIVEAYDFFATIVCTPAGELEYIQASPIDGAPCNSLLNCRLITLLGLRFASEPRPVPCFSLQNSGSKLISVRASC